MPGILSDILKPWNIVRRIKRTHEAIEELHIRFTSLEQRLERVENYGSSALVQMEADKIASLFLTGQAAARGIPNDLPSIQAAEFRAFSQWGEDGIIQFLVGRLAGRIDKSFVEFGVQHYLESNTLFLLMNNGWRGLVLDGEPKYIDSIRRRDLGWRYRLKSRCAFVSRENINDLFQEEGFGSELGLLSIDVDGIDWYLWSALTVVKPAIVVIEYNPNFPVERPITIPYEPLFDRTQKHNSNKYYGASLAALYALAVEKGYKFVGVERHHRNAFFVRNDLADLVPTAELCAEHVHWDAHASIERLSGMPVYNVVTRAIEKI